VVIKTAFMVILAFSIGVIFWTFIEYILHRFLGHVHKGKNFFKAEHLQHHAKVHYFAPASKKLFAALVVLSLLLLFLSVITTLYTAIAFCMGLFSMYALYETTHFRFHKTNPIAKPFIVLRKHHFYHHFQNSKMNFGVTTRFWDRVFGTYKEVEKVYVPEKLIMGWLIADNNIKEAYRNHFELLRKSC
jgi:4-hydroxysphinganine ceramide fatty acyl 2-hydroxylase